MTTRLAMVTGAGKGIGKSIARKLAGQGMRVIIADISGDLAEDCCAGIRVDGHDAQPICIDVCDEDSVRTGMAEVFATHGQPEVLVNNAGILSNTPYDEIGLEEWNRVFAVNLTGAMLCSQAVLPGMQERGWGRIVNIASLAGRNGGVSVGPAYAASKAGLIGFSRHLAGKVARHGVTVNVVSPGTTATDIAAQFTAEQMDAINASIPVGRLGEADEIAAAVAYFASEESGFTTGSVLDVNGGMYFG